MEGFAILKENIHTVTQKLEKGTIVELVSKNNKGTYTVKRNHVCITDVEKELMLLFNKDNIIEADILAEVTRTAREKKKKEMVTSIVNKLIRHIVKAIDNDTFSATVVCSENKVNKSQLKEAIESVKTIFTQKGYKVDTRYINHYNDIKAEITVGW